MSNASDYIEGSEEGSILKSEKKSRYTHQASQEFFFGDQLISFIEQVLSDGMAFSP